MDDPLRSWTDGAAKEAVLRFVDEACGEGSPRRVRPEERVAVFDNDGTLWCEKPVPIQLDFILRRLAEMVGQDPALRTRQPWKAAVEGDRGWLAAAVDEHYAGDDTKSRELAVGVLSGFSDISVERFEELADTFLRSTGHPTLARGYLECTYAPMLELLGLLTDHGFATYIVSGGGRDFMRPISGELYGIPRERVIGSSSALAWTPGEHGGTITRRAAADYLDDGPEKPVHIWTRTGRRPLLAAGNSDGDIEMLEYALHEDKPHLRLLVLHDDPEREFGYVAGSERALARADAAGWTVVSMKDDWTRVF